MLFQGLVGEDGHRVGQVQAPGILPHGDADAAVPVALPQPLGQSGGLFAEKQPTTVGKGHIRVVPGRFCGGQPQLGLGMLGEKVVQIAVYRQLHHRPVIQSGPAHGFFTDVESQRFDQMQMAAGGCTSASDISAILWNFRFHQNNIDHNLLLQPWTLYSFMNQITREKMGKTAKKITFFRAKEKTMKIA